MICNKCKGLGIVHKYIWKNIAGIINKTAEYQCPKCHGKGEIA